MISQTPWIDRTFNFDFPAGLYPVILERMRSVAGHIEEMVRGIPDEVLEKKIQGKWLLQRTRQMSGKKKQWLHKQQPAAILRRRLIDSIHGLLFAASLQLKGNKNDEPSKN